ncbi:MAG: ABC transporter permease [Oscillospiraceae bacterium]|jgi:ABC-2 type transport system permease protein|nr:ABC transporter permease [Oscillospiraceae bacterium]
MRRNLRLIWLLIRYKFAHMMAFQWSFWGVFFADGALFLVQLLAFETIYSQVDGIGGWSRGQMIIFVGTFSMINALNMLIYFFGILSLPSKIRQGDLDLYLTKPMNPLLRLTFESVNIGSLPLVALSALIIGYGVKTAGLQVTLWGGLGYAALVLLMTLLWYDMELILRTICFFVLSAKGIEGLEGLLLDLNFKVPGVLYKGAFKLLFYFVLPYGLMSTIPTQFIAGGIDGLPLAVAVLTVVGFTAFALRFWKFGLRHYKSASS